MLHRRAILFLLLLLAACSRAATPAPVATIPAAATPADWQAIELESLSLALPPSWTYAVADAIAPSPALDELAARNPQLAAVAREGEAALRAGHVQLIAYDLDPATLQDGMAPTSLHIGSQPNDTTLTAEQVAAANEAQLRTTPGFRNVERAAVTIAETPAMRLTSTLTITDTTGGALTFHHEQYLLIDRTTVHILSFTLPETRRAQSGALLDQILATVRLREPLQ